MVVLQKYQNKKVAIYGMGITGCSAAKVLKESKAKIFCWDDNKNTREKTKKLNLNVNKFWLNKKDVVDNIVISPGIDIKKCKIKNYLKKNKNKIITDLDIFFEINKKALIISVTGTNGKSTTCKLIEKILKTAKFNVETVGNIGNPILFSSKLKNKNVFILEASSYQLEYSKIYRSNHATILNISPDHLDRHKTMKNYIKIKSRIFLGQKHADYFYIDSKKKYSKYIKDIFKNSKVKSKLISVSKSDCNFLLKKINNKYFKSNAYIENLTFAYKIAKNLNVKDETIIKAVNGFSGLPHRQEVVLENKKILCINDSKATSFNACLQSLSNYKNIYWIVGGLPKSHDYFDLKRVKKKIIKAYIVGSKKSFFVKQIKSDVHYKISNNINNAVNDIYKDLKLNYKTKNTILLSPAAASFDQFKNFESRGVYFKNLIKKKFSRNLNV